MIIDYMEFLAIVYWIWMFFSNCFLSLLQNSIFYINTKISSISFINTSMHTAKSWSGLDLDVNMTSFDISWMK